MGRLFVHWKRFFIIISALLLATQPLLASSKSFDLYRKGLFSESMASLKKELESGQFKGLQLEAAVRRVMSMYIMHLAVSTDSVLAVLDEMSKQSHGADISFDIRTLRNEIHKLAQSSPSLNQVRNKLRSETSRGNTVASAKQAQMRVWSIHGWANRKWLQLQKGNLNLALPWLYIAGKAGFYFYNSGNLQLGEYVQHCEKNPNLSSCSDFEEAVDLNHQGMGLQLPVKVN